MHVRPVTQTHAAKEAWWLRTEVFFIYLFSSAHSEVNGDVLHHMKLPWGKNELRGSRCHVNVIHVSGCVILWLICVHAPNKLIWINTSAQNKRRKMKVCPGVSLCSSPTHLYTALLLKPLFNHRTCTRKNHCQAFKGYARAWQREESARGVNLNKLLYTHSWFPFEENVFNRPKRLKAFQSHYFPQLFVHAESANPAKLN